MKFSPINVLFVNHCATFGGAEYSFLQLIQGLDKARIHAQALLPCHGELSSELEKKSINVIIRVLPLFRAVNPFLWLCTSLQLAIYLKKQYIDIIYANSFDALVSVGLAALICKIPVIAHQRDMNRMRWIDQLFFQFANLVLFNSYATMRVTGLRSGQKKVIYNGIDTQTFTPQKRRNKSVSHKNPFTIGYAGRIAPQKDLATAVEMMTILVPKYDDIRLELAGRAVFNREIQYEKDIHALIRQNRLEPYIHFLGFKANLPDIYSRFDVLIVPSLREPFGRVIIEAMACQCPVIATRSGGPEEIIQDGEDGLLVPVQNPQEFADKVGFLYQNPAIHEAMAEKAREKVCSQFSIEQYISQIEHEIINLAG